VKTFQDEKLSHTRLQTKYQKCETTRKSQRADTDKKIRILGKVEIRSVFVTKFVNVDKTFLPLLIFGTILHVKIPVVEKVKKKFELRRRQHTVTKQNENLQT